MYSIYFICHTSTREKIALWIAAISLPNFITQKY